MQFLRYSDLVDRRIVNSRATLSSWIHNRGFPRPLKLSGRHSVWRAEEVERWVAENLQAA